MKKVNLEAQKREVTGKKVSALRRNGLIPAVVYGHDMESFQVSVPSKDFSRVIMGDAGTNAIIELKINDDMFTVLAHQIQKDILSDNILHVDFLLIRMDEEIKTKVHVELIGESIGVKRDAGILVHNIREIELECLPDRIPEKFEIDVSNLNIGDNILVSDIKTQEGIKILADKDDVIVHISAPSKEEETPPPIEGVMPPSAEGAVPVEGVAGAPASGATPKEGAKPAAEKTPK
ncbi:hypothetical protein A3J90_03880 [candidate division WOR-1 bacterium RIFOXYC2_FULL_37_10]|nr:MAG: hypothetical protein A3J90_03880 [candidate division WOR-1 bacterium RIFOXYC2_FULL_37_10]